MINHQVDYKMSLIKPIKLLLPLALTLLSPNVFANEQIVFGNIEPQLNVSSNDFILVVNYETDISESSLSGLGLRVHYDSSIVQFNNVGNVLGTGLLVNEFHPQEDISDFDSDPLTDKYILMSWASLNNNWPSEHLPVLLCQLGFTDISAQNSISNINFSASSTAAGYDFYFKPVSINLR
jgi:hypothetical protein